MLLDSPPKIVLPVFRIALILVWQSGNVFAVRSFEPAAGIPGVQAGWVTEFLNAAA